MPAPKHDRRSTHSTPRQRWDFRCGQRGAPAAVYLTEASPLHPVLPVLFDAPPGAPDEVPPGDDPHHRMHPPGLRPPCPPTPFTTSGSQPEFRGCSVQRAATDCSTTRPAWNGEHAEPGIETRSAYYTRAGALRASDEHSVGQCLHSPPRGRGSPGSRTAADVSVHIRTDDPRIPGADTSRSRLLGSIRMHGSHVGPPVTKVSNRSASVPPQPASDRHEPPRSLANPTWSDLQK